MEHASLKIRERNGQALLTALIFLLALTFMGFGLVTMSSIDVQSSRNLRLADEALVAAEEGVFLGLAWAGNPDTNFINLAEGATVRLRSTTNAGKSASDRAHYDVLVTMGGITEAPAGTQVGKGGGQAVQFYYLLIRVQSVGMVTDTPKSVFDFLTRPQIKRTIDVMAKVKKASS